MKKIIIVMLFSIVIFGCVTVQPLNTISGKPEVIINIEDKEKIKDSLVNSMMNEGFYLKTTNEYNLVFGKISNDIATSLLYGSRYDTSPELIVSFSIVKVNNGYRLIATLNVITNPGSAFERVTDLSYGSTGAHYYQKCLQFTKTKLENEKEGKIGRIGIIVDGKGSFIIDGIIENSPADRAGILVGDKIIRANDKELEDGDVITYLNEIPGKPGTKVKIEIQRGNEKLIFILEREIIENE